MSDKISDKMEKVSFNVEPRDLIRQLIILIYEQNINQYKEACGLTNLKYATYEFLYEDDNLSDEYIDKICSNLTNDDTLKIENTNDFRYRLWKSLINSEKYLNFLNNRPILESGVFDTKYNREYEADYGEHFLSIISALKDTGINELEYDFYIEENLLVYGKNSKNSTFEFIPILDENKIKPVDKRKLVNDYQQEFWIKDK